MSLCSVYLTENNQPSCCRENPIFVFANSLLRAPAEHLNLLFKAGVTWWPKGLIQTQFHQRPAASLSCFMPCCEIESLHQRSELVELSWTNGNSFPSFQKANRYRSISHRHPPIPIFHWEWFYYERNSQAISTLCLSMTLGIEFGGFMCFLEPQHKHKALILSLAPSDMHKIINIA